MIMIKRILPCPRPIMPTRTRQALQLHQLADPVGEAVLFGDEAAGHFDVVDVGAGEDGGGGGGGGGGGVEVGGVVWAGVVVVFDHVLWDEGVHVLWLEGWGRKEGWRERVERDVAYAAESQQGATSREFIVFTGHAVEV